MRNGIGYVGKYPDSPARCYPAAPKLECNLCARRMHGRALDAEARALVVIDASAVHQPGTCALWIGRPMAPIRVEPRELEMA